MNFLSRAKRILVGKPIASKHAHHERLPKRIALPVFASDALSSTAYATEEIMRVFLIIGASGAFGAAFLHKTFEISIWICLLIVVVAISYRQTIYAYPGGGGSYTVAKENLGTFPGEVAGASLLIDYILTVAVSVSAGVLAIISMNPGLTPYIVHLALFFIGMLTIANLRGAKESGAIFAIPTYGFILCLGGMIVWGLTVPGAPVPPEIIEARQNVPPDYQTLSFLFVFMVLRAFSSGCTALTGIEAISNGTQAFKEPVSKNASITLMVMAGILSFLFIGTSFLAEKFHVIPRELDEPNFRTVVALISEQVFPRTTAFGNGYFVLLQVMTAAILILAANTAYADFPRLASLISRDGYLPRQLGNQGDRLVFQNGILVLSAVSALLIIKFNGDPHKLIPLYAIGVFLGFTLSQAGMAVHNYKLKRPFGNVLLSGVGGTVTGIITIVIAVTKFKEGAWIVPIALTLVLLTFTGIKRHYKYLAAELEIAPGEQVVKMKTTVLMLVPKLHRGVLQAIGYSLSLADDVRAIHVTIDPNNVTKVKGDWDRFGAEIPLVILQSPFRSLIDPIVEYIDQTLEEEPDMMITVIVPEAVPRHWYHRFLHNNVAIALKLALGSRRNVVVTNVRYFLK
jgi:amino acid transporter